jgi:hypothetical protein
VKDAVALTIAFTTSGTLPNLWYVWYVQAYPGSFAEAHSQAVWGSITHVPDKSHFRLQHSADSRTKTDKDISIGV